jgi:ribosomal protein S18 acetylase RimI-like enzyme
MDGEDAGVLQVESYVDEIFLALILIAPAFQGQGLGTAVICDVQAQARAAGLPLTLQVLKANPRARRLYERLGFEVVEEREERYVMRWEMGD